MNGKRKIIVGVTGASGAIYARLLVEKLLEQEDIGKLALIFSDNGEAVAHYEGQVFPDEGSFPALKIYRNDDMFAPAASGSAMYGDMVIVPCSAGTMGRIASGVSGNLIERSADVMLKERRRLILAVRETPLSTIHLRNMTALSECGAIIMPASPSFYSFPQTIEAVCMSVVERILTLLEFDTPRYEWSGRNV